MQTHAQADPLYIYKVEIYYFDNFLDMWIFLEKEISVFASFDLLVFLSRFSQMFILFIIIGFALVTLFPRLIDQNQFSMISIICIDVRIVLFSKAEKSNIRI